MPPIHVAVATRCFRQPLKQSIETAAEIGADAVQLDARNELKPAELSATGRRQFLHKMGELGLSVASVSFPTRRTLYDQDQLEARLTAIKAAMQFASQLKARVVTARVGRIPQDVQSADYGLLREVLNELAGYGNKIGAALSITPTGDSAASLAELLRSVTEGPLGINFDPAIFVMSEQNPLEAFSRLHSSVMHVQIRDAIRDIDGSGLEVPVGRGEVPWDELLAMFDEAGFRGWLTVERTHGDDRLNDVARAVEYLRRLAME